MLSNSLVAGRDDYGVQLPFDADTYDSVMSRLSWIVYHRMTEPSGVAVADATGHGFDGAWFASTPQYQNIDGPGTTMGKAPLLSGDDVINYWSAGLAAALTPAQLGEITICLWLRPNGTFGGRPVSLRTDANNRLLIYMPSATTLAFFAAYGGVTASESGSIVVGSWTNVMLSISKANNRLRARVNGAQVGVDQPVTASAWVGAIGAALTCWGAESSSPLGSPYAGHMFRGGILDHEVTNQEAALIATPI